MDTEQHMLAQSLVTIYLFLCLSSGQSRPDEARPHAAAVRKFNQRLIDAPKWCYHRYNMNYFFNLAIWQYSYIKDIVLIVS